MNCKFLYPCRLVIVNDSDFGEVLEKASNNLKRDGLKFFVKQYQVMQMEKCRSTLSDQASSEIINKINYAMANFENPQILQYLTVYFFSICKAKACRIYFCTDDEYRDIPA